MIGYIYKTTCLPENKIYVGKKQKKHFITSYYGSGRIITKKLKEYSIDCFKVELIDTADTVKELLQKEIYWIALLDARNPDIGYNIDIGGDKGSTGHIKIRKDNLIKRIWMDELPIYLNLGWTWVDSYSKEYMENYNIVNEAELKEYRHTYYLNNSEKIKERARQYAQVNKEKIKIRNKKYNESHKQEISKKKHFYYLKNREKLIAYQKTPRIRQRAKERNKKYYDSHKKDINKKRKLYLREYRLKNKDKVNQRQREYRLKNKDILNKKRREWRLTHKEKTKEYNKKQIEKKLKK